MQRGAINECLKFGRDQGGWNVQKWFLLAIIMPERLGPQVRI